MKTWRNFVIVLLALFFCIGFHLSNIHAQPKPSSVIVVNPGSSPVPVAGNVGIISMPEIKVTNPIEAVQRQITCDPYLSYPEAPLCRCEAMIYQVPSGKRLVIEFVSMVEPSEDKFHIQTAVGGYRVEHGLTPVYPYSWGGQQVRIYADSDEYGVVVKTTYPSACYSTHPKPSFTISGYLIDLP